VKRFDLTHGHGVKISNIRTGALICKFGELICCASEAQHPPKHGLIQPRGIAVTSDSSFVIVVDEGLNYRSRGTIKVLRLVID
jgi:hypothetical protein